MTPHPKPSRPKPRLTNRRKRTTPSAGSRAIRLQRQKITFSRSTGRGERATLTGAPVSQVREGIRTVEVVARSSDPFRDGNGFFDWAAWPAQHAHPDRADPDQSLGK